MCSPNIYNDELDTNKCWRFNTYSSTKFSKYIQLIIYVNSLSKLKK